MEKIALLLHPVRMRVILALANRVLTTQQLATLLSDVTQTTLYRQINLLLDGGILRVVSERKVRGTIERELTVVEGAARIDMETSAALPTEQQEQLFTLFVATLLTDFRQALSQPLEGLPPALYRRQRVSMSLEALQRLNQEMDALLSAYSDPPPEATDADIRQWLVTGIIMPDADIPQREDNN